MWVREGLGVHGRPNFLTCSPISETVDSVCFLPSSTSRIQFYIKTLQGSLAGWLMTKSGILIGFRFLKS